MHKFKVGDKLRLTHKTAPSGESDGHNWAESDHLAFEGIYTVQELHTENAPTEYVHVSPRGINNYWIAEWQFERYKPTNEERVRMRMDEIKAGV